MSILAAVFDFAPHAVARMRFPDCAKLVGHTIEVTTGQQFNLVYAGLRL